MKFYLKSLTLSLRKATVKIPFFDVNYFWGQMGAGKTTIARMIDYCLGGDIELTPAMQGEFVSATLHLSLANGDASIERPRDSDRIIASWGAGDDAFRVNIPARKPDGEVLPGTGVEQLSDLLFWLSGLTAPRVRKSKIREDSETARLSIRDLLWYCYLDQDEIDSSFFHLEDNAIFYMRNKSRDVIRYVIGFHDERVAEIEAALDQLRGEKQGLSATVSGLTRVLKEIGVESEAQIMERKGVLQLRADHLLQDIEAARQHAESERLAIHAVDEFREQARSLGDEIARLDDAIANLREAQDRDQRHLNEIETLSLKFRRSNSAKAVLVGVTFQSCPRCAQRLPDRDQNCCSVCGQEDQIDLFDPAEASLVERDAKSRISELTEILDKHEESLAQLKRDRDGVSEKKLRVERLRNEAEHRYDTAYLSRMLSTEHERASLLQEVDSLAGMARLPQMLEVQRAKVVEITEREHRLRMELKEARAAAESDEENLNNLKGLFLDCLVRAGVRGITIHDRVEINPRSFFPEVYGPDREDERVTTFGTLSSGGKKTLFKCCFAIALHRLAIQLRAPLPQLLIIDSPMKNISERENRDQFEGFYRLLYELKESELQETQIILVDKEYSAPMGQHRFTHMERHMRPGDAEFPPLIPYYDGK